MAPVPDSIGFVYEREFLRVVGVPRSTWKNWAAPKHGLVEEAGDGRYREADVIETVCVAQLVAALRDLGDVGRVWKEARDGVLDTCANLPAGGDLLALVETRTLRLTLASSHAEAGRALRPLEPVVPIPLAERVSEGRSDFWRFAVTTDPPADGRRRDARGSADESASVTPD